MTTTGTREPMRLAQRQARAIQKATEQRAHVWALPGRPGFYQVRSATDAAERYVVAVEADGRITCSCPAGGYDLPCWHAEKLRTRRIREARRRRQLLRVVPS